MSLRARPLDDLQTMDWETLPGFWRRTTLTLICKRPCGLQDGPWLPGVIRGAWGRQLLDMAQTNNTGNLTGRDVFFATQGRLRPGFPVPPPFVITVEPKPPNLRIQLTLFGRAEGWRQEAFDALVHAMEAGVSVFERGGHPREPCQVLDAQWTRMETVPVLSFCNGARLLFKTPVRIGPSGAGNVPVPNLIVSLAARVASLARWQGFDVPVDTEAWQHLAEMLDIETNGLIPVGWHRRSSMQSGRNIPMAGYCGAVHSGNVPGPLAILLCLGETCFAGQHASFGMGHYILS